MLTFPIDSSSSPLAAGNNVDGFIERIVRGETTVSGNIGYAPDSDDDDENRRACGMSCAQVSVGIKNEVIGVDKRSDAMDNQISISEGLDELKLDHEAKSSFRSSQNSYSGKCFSRINRTGIRKLFNEVMTFDRSGGTLGKADRLVSSQEPGVLTQAKAMNVVENLLIDNDVDLGEEIGPKENNAGSNSPPKLSVRGAQCLAKWANHRSSVRKSTTFDWDETALEDNKGDCLNGRLESRAKIESLEQQEDVDDVGVQHEMYDIGPNTQIAAEAMEALLHGSPISHGDEMASRTESVKLNEDLNISMPVDGAFHKAKLMRKRSGSEHKIVRYKRRKLPITKLMKGSRNSKVKNKSEKTEDRTGATKQNWEHGSLLNARVSRSPNSQSSDSKSSMLEYLHFDAIPVAPRTRRPKPVKISKRSSVFNAPVKEPETMDASKPSTRTGDVNLVLDIAGTMHSKTNGANKVENQSARLYKQKQEIDQKKQRLSLSALERSAIKPLKSNLTTSGEVDLCAKQKISAVSVTANQSNGVQTSTNDCRVVLKSLSEVLDKVKRKKRTSSNAKEASTSRSENDSEASKLAFSEVRLAVATDNSYVGDHRESAAEVLPSEKATASASNGQSMKKEDTTVMLSLSCMAPKASRGKSSRKSLMARELSRLKPTDPATACLLKDSRRRKDMSKVRVLFSNNLDEDKVKKQKKILARFGTPVASSIADATHFVADRFARTKNMLEAMAMGKPIVTHMWLDSCAQTNYFIDERNYLLRDLKKEKEIGFSMAVSLARSCECPLLMGRRVLVTPNVKPDLEVVASLVKAAQGQLLENNGDTRGSRKNANDLLVISCEEDYQICASLLDKGVGVFSSELILNGIIIQKLEFERHQLFVNHVKRDGSDL